jgi:hypothetical protein
MNLLSKLRSIVWSSVLAVACVVLAIAVALFIPTAIALVVALGLSSIALAILSFRV